MESSSNTLQVQQTSLFPFKASSIYSESSTDKSPNFASKDQQEKTQIRITFEHSDTQLDSSHEQNNKPQKSLRRRDTQKSNTCDVFYNCKNT